MAITDGLIRLLNDRMRQVIGILVLFFSWSSQAQTNLGNSFPSSSLSFSPMSIAVGGNLISHPNPTSGLYVDNPALLDSTQSGKVQLAYNRYVSKTNATQCFYSTHVPKSKWNFAYGLKYFGYGDLDRYDVNGNAQGQFNASDATIKGIASYALDSNWTLGIGVSEVFSQLDRTTMAAQTFDFGAHYWKRSGNWTLDFMLKNVGWLWGGSGAKSNYQLPSDWIIGFSKKPKNAPFRFLASVNQFQKMNQPVVRIEGVAIPKWELGDRIMRHATVGSELNLGGLKFYAGYNYQRRADLKLVNSPGMAGISMGVGIKTKRWELIYSWSKYHAASSVNGFGIVFQPFSNL